MNRRERRRAKAMQRSAQAPQQNLRRALMEEAQATAPGKAINDLPDDIKVDIAKTVRSVEWTVLGVRLGGMCFFCTMTGWMTLQKLGIESLPCAGGMVYRVGPDEYRDVVAFCSPSNKGIRMETGFLGHWFVLAGGFIIDFSVGDWRTLNLPDVEIGPKLGPIQWALEPPDFFWAPYAEFAPVQGQRTPELGRAWYTPLDDVPPFDGMLDDMLDAVIKHIDQTLEFYALRERVWAHCNGHTAIRLFRLAEISTDRDLAARAMQAAAATKLQDRLVVLRGKGEITPAIAAEILAEGLAAM